jgi:3-oxoacyl-[acyl-carrier-protein] synthase II
MKKNKRVVVTGLGIVSSTGIGIKDFWENIVKGKSGIKKITRFNTDSYSSKIGGEINDFDPNNYIDKKNIRRNDRYIHFSIAATKLAKEDGKINFNKIDKSRIGVIIASGIGGMETIEKQSSILFKKGIRRISPFMIPSLISNMASGIVAIQYGFLGPNYGIVSACASSAHAIGESFNIIKSNRADIMIVGGSEAAITKLGYAGFCSMKAMSRNFNNSPEKASRPFDRDRDGFVMSEGSGILILESLEHALNRKASKIYCELSSYASSCDAYHITKPHPKGRGLSICLKNILKNSNIKKEEIDYINAHGTSTQYNDFIETIAIKRVFKDYSYKIPISSTKSITGHLLGAAGAVEAIISSKTIETGLIPPTINYNKKDPKCDLDYVPNIVRVKNNIKNVISNNLGFGGQNASLLFKKFYQ